MSYRRTPVPRYYAELEFRAIKFSIYPYILSEIYSF